MRLIILAVGILLMGIPAYYGLWPLALVAALLTALALVRLFQFYRSIPFLLALLGFLSFCVGGSVPIGEPGEPVSSRVIRGTLFAAISLATSLMSALACGEILVVHRGGGRRQAYNMMLSLLVAPLFPTKNPFKKLFTRISNAFRALQIVQDGRVTKGFGGG